MGIYVMGIYVMGIYVMGIYVMVMADNSVYSLYLSCLGM